MALGCLAHCPLLGFGNVHEVTANSGPSGSSPWPPYVSLLGGIAGGRHPIRFARSLTRRCGGICYSSARPCMALSPDSPAVIAGQEASDRPRLGRRSMNVAGRRGSARCSDVRSAFAVGSRALSPRRSTASRGGLAQQNDRCRDSMLLPTRAERIPSGQLVVSRRTLRMGKVAMLRQRMVQR